MQSIIHHFEALCDCGLKVIPLRENSKIPVEKKWNQNWNKEHHREYLKRFPDSNIGVLLGNIVDVEGDSEEANRMIISLIGDYPHPCYMSKKSIHHLFLTPDRNLRHFRWEQIEFRGAGHQSVLPPSQHEGVKYQWLKKFKFPIPEMPEKLFKFYQNKFQNKIKHIKHGHIQVWCASCKKKLLLHEKRFRLELEALKMLGSKWECQVCRTIDLRPACRMIRSGVSKKIVIAQSLNSPILS